MTQREPRPASRQPFGRLPTLTDLQVDAYLARIDLNAAEIRRKPLDYRTLAELQLAHLLTVPFDNTQMHIGDEDFAVQSTSKHLDLGSGPGIQCNILSAFHAIVQQRRGGYCFVCNTLFSALLRHLGYVVSEVAARVNSARNTDPANHGIAWGGLAHMALVVDVDEQRYLVDVGFGGGAAEHPVPLKDGEAHMRSVHPDESFVLRHELLPGVEGTAFRDLPLGWTLYRRFEGRNGTAGFEAPCYHFMLQSLTPQDWQALNYYNSTSPEAPFAKQCLVSRLRSDGKRDVFSFGEGDERARWYLRDGNLGSTLTQEAGPRRAYSGAILEEEWIEPTVGEICRILRKRFGIPTRPRTISRIASA